MKKARLTIDMTQQDHGCLKMACAKLGVSMREFVLQSAFEKIEELEDEKLAERAHKVLKEIKAGKRKTISLDEMKKRYVTPLFTSQPVER